MKKAIVIIFAIAALIAAGCSQIYPVEKASSEETGNAVTIKGFAFNPAEIKVTAGSSVMWVNEDSAPHTVKFESVESEKMNNGGKYSHTFTEPGEYDYICGIHPSMKGKVIVQ